MCGIIAYVGANCTENILNGLKQLQNRGYDSLGISKVVDKKFKTYKYASTTTQNAIDILESNVRQDQNMMSNTVATGIGHSRWATTGPKTDNNAHPHCSMDGKFSIVHNGIIENYATIKEHLILHGYTFQSLTDSEVIANLITYEYKNMGENDVLTAIKRTLTQLEGTWGIAILCTDLPNTIFCTRHGSPILVSANDDFAMVVSEQSGFCGKVENYHILKNNEICIIEETNQKIKMTIKCLVENTDVAFEPRTVTSTSGIGHQTTPHPYIHWTIKEIYEQQESALRAMSLGGRLHKKERVKLGGLDDNRKVLKKITNLIILGCGTSHYAGALGAYYMKDLCQFHSVQNIDAAEFTEKDISPIGNTAMILLSQSGETKDLYDCMEIGKKHNIFLIGVINVVDSMIAREVNCGCYLNAGKEVAVASTKSFTSQIILLSMIAIWFAQLHAINIEKRKKYINDLRQLDTDIKTTIHSCVDRIHSFLPIFENAKSCFVLGKGKAEAIAREGSLKIKELSKIHAEGYSTSSLKHGPFALLEPGFPVIIIAANNADISKAENSYQEVVSRHAEVIFITDKIDCLARNAVYLPSNNTFFELLSVIPLQFLAYYLATERDINPDMPANLAKVVSV